MFERVRMTFFIVEDLDQRLLSALVAVRTRDERDKRKVVLVKAALIVSVVPDVNVARFNLEKGMRVVPTYDLLAVLGDLVTRFFGTFGTELAVLLPFFHVDDC